MALGDRDKRTRSLRRCPRPVDLEYLAALRGGHQCEGPRVSTIKALTNTDQTAITTEGDEDLPENQQHDTVGAKRLQAACSASGG